MKFEISEQISYFSLVGYRSTVVALRTFAPSPQDRRMMYKYRAILSICVSGATMPQAPQMAKVKTESKISIKSSVIRHHVNKYPKYLHKITFLLTLLMMTQKKANPTP